MSQRLSHRPVARAALLGVILMLLSSMATSVVHALWHQEVSWQVPPIGTAHVGLSVKVGGVDYAATAAQPQARFEIGPQEAAAVQSTQDGTATAFQVQASSQGHLGLSYSIELDTAEPGGVFAATAMAIHVVPNQSECTVLLAPNYPLVDSVVTATGTAYAQFKSHDQWYCLVMEFNPEQLGGYSTTAETTGSGPNESNLSDNDQWEVDFLADPQAEPPFGITVMPQISRAEENAIP